MSDALTGWQWIRPATLATVIFLALSGCKGDAEAEQSQALPVSAVAVTHAAVAWDRIEETELAIASIHAARTPQLGTEVEGVVKRVIADAGSRVRRNDLLAIIDDGEHQLNHRRAQAELSRIDVQIEQKHREIDRLQRLHEGGSTSQLSLEEAQSDLATLELERIIAQADFESAERRLARTRVLAPYEGVIAARHANEGDYVSEGTILFELTDHSLLQIRIPLPESLLDRLAEGQEVRLWREGEEETPVIAAIDRINPNIDDASRALTIISYLEEGSRTWRAGGNLRAEVVLESREALLVPPEAVVRRPSGHVVYLLEEEQVQARPVEAGLLHRDWVEIRSGLAAGDQVIIDGAGFLTDGARVQPDPIDWHPHDHGA